jgi:uncharacterized YigZ family protein
MSDTYQRPAKRQRTEITVNKSRFVTTVAKAISVDEARHFIRVINDEMPDASHHVYAFCVGYGNSVTEGMSDDGEPSGTAGPPTLAVLRGNEIGDVVLVTTRFFGGIKLGTGGLVRAYTEAAQVALEHLDLELKAPRVQIGFDISYSMYEPVVRLVEKYQGHLNDEIFSGDVTLITTLLITNQEAFLQDLQEITHGQAEPVILKTIDV